MCCATCGPGARCITSLLASQLSTTNSGSRHASDIHVCVSSEVGAEARRHNMGVKWASPPVMSEEVRVAGDHRDETLTRSSITAIPRARRMTSTLLLGNADRRLEMTGGSSGDCCSNPSWWVRIASGVSVGVGRRYFGGVRVR